MYCGPPARAPDLIADNPLVDQAAHATRTFAGALIEMVKTTAGRKALRRRIATSTPYSGFDADRRVMAAAASTPPCRLRCGWRQPGSSAHYDVLRRR